MVVSTYGFWEFSVLLYQGALQLARDLLCDDECFDGKKGQRAVLCYLKRYLQKGDGR